MSYQVPPATECTEVLDLSLPPFEGRNARNPRHILLAYTSDSHWQKRSGFVSDPQDIVVLLIRKWTKELGGRLMRELWAWSGAKIAVQFACERQASAGKWIRSRRSEKGKFGAKGLMKRRLACISDVPSDEPDRRMYRDRRSSRAADRSAPFHLSSELKAKRRLK
jgi:nuclear transport factor 2 (NTF2) superfamily protein